MGMEEIMVRIYKHKYTGIVCSKDGCNKQATISGMCDSHYRSTWKTNRNSQYVENKDLCKVEGCGKVKKSGHLGYCTMHFKRLRRNGTLDRVLGVARKCEVDGCNELGTGKDVSLCIKHRHNRDRYGDPNLTYAKVHSTPCDVPGCSGNTYKRYKADHLQNISGVYCKRHRSILWKYDLGGKSFTDYFGYGKYYCAICKRELNTDKPDGVHIDHSLPKSRGGTDSINNLQLLCKDCNTGKMSMTTEEYIEHCRKVVSNHVGHGKTWASKA
jgi:5-methylcytosine-specific restriction endonuclease McrA